MLSIRIYYVLEIFESKDPLQNGNIKLSLAEVRKHTDQLNNWKF